MVSCVLAARSLCSSNRSASAQRSYRGVMSLSWGGGGVLHSSLTGQFYPASTGMGRRLVRSFAAAVGWFQSCRLVQGWGVLQFKDESIMTGMVS